MKIIYDISILGLGHADQNFRKGIFRVVENVTEHLVKHPGTEMIFSSSLNDETIKNSIAFLGSDPKFKNTSFSVPFILEHRYDARKKRQALVEAVYGDNAEPFLLKLAQKILFSLAGNI